MKKIYFIGLAILFLGLWSSCTSSKNVTMNAMRPADITLGHEVHEILLIDRTEFNNKNTSILEGVLTGELPQEDRASVQELMNTLKNQVDVSPRFSVVVASERLKGNSLTTVFPEQIAWKEVERLCNKYNTQILVAIEIFDTDFIPLEVRDVITQRANPNDPNSTIAVKSFKASGTGKIKMGVRIYDPFNKRIIDQEVINDRRNWSANGNTRLEAANALIGKQNANLQMARQIGLNYAYKITPQPIRITRSLYSKQKKERAVAQGTRYADVNQWQEAIKIWERALPSVGDKQAGMLTYNIAVAYEVLGEFDLAVEYARKAYTRYGNSNAQSYVYSLEQRMQQDEILKQQLKSDREEIEEATEAAEEAVEEALKK